MARCRNQPNELCVCMTAAARNQRKVVREELFACPRAIHPQLGHLGRRVLATEFWNGFAPETQMPTLQDVMRW